VHLNRLNWNCANTHVTWAMWQPLNEKPNIALPSPLHSFNSVLGCYTLATQVAT